MFPLTNPAASLRRSLLVLALGTSLVASPASAQGQVVNGDTIRLVARERELPRAVYLHTDSTWIYQRVLAAGDTQRVVRADITRAEVLRGHRRAGLGSIGHGALIGGGVGFLAGVVAVTGSNTPDKGEAISPAVAVAAITVVGVAIGTVAGALAAFRDAEVWTTFDIAAPDSARASALSLRHALGPELATTLQVTDVR